VTVKRSAALALVVIQLAVLVVVAGVTVWRFHVWADVDERPHYDYVQKLAENHALPRPTDLVSPEVQAITDRTWPRPSHTDRRRIGIAGRSYEAFQPPLYYVVAVPAFSVASDHRAKLFVLRAFDMALLLAAAWLLWRLARRVAGPGGQLIAFAAGLSVLLWPGVVVRAVTVGNTPLELVLATAFLLVLWRADREQRPGSTLIAAALLGLCLLTKLWMVALVPLFAVVLARALLRDRSRRQVARTAVALLIPVLLIGPWVAGNYARYGRPTVNLAGGDLVASAPSGAAGSRIETLPGRAWRVADGVLPQEFNGKYGVAWVRVAALVLLLALVVAAVALLLSGRGGAVWFFGLPVATGSALMIGAYLFWGTDAFLLRYLYALLPPLAIAVAGAALRTPASRYVAATAGVLTLVAIALWVDLAGSYYFVDIGRRLGIG
jgi:4-amino-4-deoxy-L-arabinose transferase-like glycosyltransferase